MDLSRIEEALDEPLYDQLGRVSKVVGLTIESIGPEAKLNDLCKIQRRSVFPGLISIQCDFQPP